MPAMARDREADAMRPGWPELLFGDPSRARREELVLALLAALGGLFGVLLGAGALVLASAPPPLLRPAEGLALAVRVLVVIPIPVLLGGRAALRAGEQLLRRGRGADGPDRERLL